VFDFDASYLARQFIAGGFENIRQGANLACVDRAADLVAAQFILIAGVRQSQRGRKERSQREQHCQYR
jgi:hypothetical protein